MPHIHWVARGTGIPKDRDEVNRREVSECDGWVCDFDMMGAPSKWRVIRKVVSLTRGRPTLFLICWTKAVRRKWNWPPRHDINLDMLIWLSESSLGDWFSEVSLIRDNQAFWDAWWLSWLFRLQNVYSQIKQSGRKEKNSWLLGKMFESGFPDASGREEG